MKQKTASRSIKILVAKLGLDGHDRSKENKAFKIYKIEP